LALNFCRGALHVRFLFPCVPRGVGSSNAALAACPVAPVRVLLISRWSDRFRIRADDQRESVAGSAARLFPSFVTTHGPLPGGAKQQCRRAKGLLNLGPGNAAWSLDYKGSCHQGIMTDLRIPSAGRQGVLQGDQKHLDWRLAIWMATGLGVGWGGFSGENSIPAHRTYMLFAESRAMSASAVKAFSSFQKDSEEGRN